MYIKRILVLMLVIILGITMYGCKAVDVMKDLVSNEEEPEVEIIRSDVEEDIEISNEVKVRDTVLYFQNENGYLIPVKRQIPWETGIAKAALRNMIDSPILREDLGAIGLSPIIPAGTQIRGMAIHEDTGLCKVDFTEDILNYESQKDEENLVRGIVYTLTEFPAVSKVQFMIEGKIVDKLKYGTDVSKPLNREDINLMSAQGDYNSKVVVYYKGTSNGEYEYYVPVTIPTSAPQANVLTALKELFKGAPASSGLYTDIPDTVQLQGVEVSDGIAYIDLSVSSIDSIASEPVFNSMVSNIGLTLRQFEEIEDIEILIDGKTAAEAGIEFGEPEGIPVFANEY
ncbi:GerMN domain-containing protein [Thermohalobacter berrensis]|uniref:Spore gernimation protein GerM n=1 Tax=Thermohalobacter berrensis TaxID=99594 RepID=A0A419SUU2_9FIRM|nr:GerMN domain-containing protein [Thermohalobacter berrensis]RKD28986.1 spore gernimation protein GerM [Thermohalobacter berrensis]